MSEAPHSDIGPVTVVPDFDAFVERELAFCVYLVAPLLDALGAEEIMTAQRGLWEGWQSGDGRPYGT